MNNKRNQLLGVIEHSEAMLKQAQAGNWENVFSFEEQRSNTLKKLFTQAFSQQDKDDNNEIILQILSINKKLEAITTKARDEIRNQAGSINKGRHAVGVYAQNAG